MRYKSDGSPISSAVPVGTKNAKEHKQLFGIYRGVIVTVVYPDDPKNITKDRVEYVIKVKGQLFPNAIEVKAGGGKFNYSERIRKPTEVSSSGALNQKTYDELLDGEHVYVAFLEGYGNTPLIIGGAEHPARGTYKKIKKTDGVFSVDEFNGVEVSIDKDSNYMVKHVGRKDPKGKIADEKAVGAMLKLFGNGNILFDTSKTAGDKPLLMLFDKAGKKFEIQAQENVATFDDTGMKFTDKFGNISVFDTAGIKITDKSGNIIEMKSGEVKITVAGNIKLAIDGNIDMTATGNATVKATGNATVEADGKVIVKGTAGTDVGSASSITKVDGTQVLLAGGGPPVARLGDMVVGTGNLGAPIVANILQGSTKVKAG